MTFGPRQWRRCANKPVVIVTEKRPGPDGEKGSMSLCTSCREAFFGRAETNQDDFAVEEIAS